MKVFSKSLSLVLLLLLSFLEGCVNFLPYRQITPSPETRRESSPQGYDRVSQLARNEKVHLLPPHDKTLFPGELLPVKYEPARPKDSLQPGAENSPTQVLSLESLIDQVLARNPTLAQMAAAWQAASARYPQARSWDDPMFQGAIAPASFCSRQVEPGYQLEISQKIYFPGKLALRGQGALAEASAAGNDLDDVRLQLIESAKLAFFEYFLSDRALAVNEESLRLLREFRKNAEARFKTGLAPQQDILQAEVEIGKQQEREVILGRMRKVAAARLNTLMSLPPDLPLLPPPGQIARGGPLPPVEELRSQAQAQRPDLKALADRIAADAASLALAFREYYPDVEALAAYNTIMGNGPMHDLAPQLGFRMNLPVRRSRRQAAVTEAQARLGQRQAELASRINQVNFQVQEAYEQFLESERVWTLYEKNILPAARENVKAAQAAYVTGKTPFLSLIEAQRNLVGLQDRYYEANADYFRRLATLERVIGKR